MEKQYSNITELKEDVKNISKNIEVIENKNDILFVFNSKIYKSIKKLPIFLIKDLSELDNFILNFNIKKQADSLSNDVIDVMDFYNERRSFFTEVDKQIVKDEILQAVTDLYKELMDFHCSHTKGIA